MKTDAPKTPIESLPADIQKFIQRLKRQREHYRLEAKALRAQLEGQQAKPTK